MQGFKTTSCISGEQGRECLKLRGTWKGRQFWGTGNKINQEFDFWEQGDKTIIGGEQGRASLLHLARPVRVGRAPQKTGFLIAWPSYLLV